MRFREWLFASKIAMLFWGLSALTLSIAASAGSEAQPLDKSPSAAAAIDLSQYRGKIVYLDFWASWCGPCRLSFPFMNALHATREGKDFVVVAVNMDRDRAAAQRFLSQHPASFAVSFDPKGDLASRFHVSEMPTTVILNRNGQVAAVHKGFFPKNEAEYRNEIDRLIAAH